MLWMPLVWSCDPSSGATIHKFCLLIMFQGNPMIFLHFFKKFLILCMYMCLYEICTHESKCPQGQKRTLDPLSRRYRHLWNTWLRFWALNLAPLEGRKHIPNHWASSLVTSIFLFVLLLLVFECPNLFIMPSIPESMSSAWCIPLVKLSCVCGVCMCAFVYVWWK